MEYLTMVYDTTLEAYAYHYSNSTALTVLYYFLLSVTTPSAFAFYRNWVLDDKQVEFSADAVHLKKIGDYIHIRDLYPTDINNPACICITVLNYTTLLNTWERALIAHAQEITIKRDTQGTIIIQTQ